MIKFNGVSTCTDYNTVVRNSNMRRTVVGAPATAHPEYGSVAKKRGMRFGESRSRRTPNFVRVYGERTSSLGRVLAMSVGAKSCKVKKCR